jgi:hypothetical protein
MEPHTADPIQLIKKLTESHREIRFGRGVVGKTGHGMVALLAVWFIIVWRWSGTVFADAGLVLVGVAATCAFVWWVKSTQTFAERNPAQALLEGAELLEYQKFEAQAKGISRLPASPISEGRLEADGQRPRD